MPVSAGVAAPAPPVPAAPGRPVRRGGGGALSILAVGGLAVGALGIALLAARDSRNDETPDPAPIPLPTGSGGPTAPVAPSAPSAPLTANPGPSAAPPVASGSPQPLDAGFRDRLKKATVLIHVRSTLSGSTGSGFFVDSRGLIATNHHVIDGPGRVSVQLFGAKREIEDVTCVATDPQRDLALLRLDGARPEHVLTLHRGPPVPETTPVVVVGHPRGELWSMTLGTITGHRTHKGQPFLGTDARIEPGNSGGPVALQGSGEVIGISDWKIEATNMNYAIPVQALIDFIQRNGDRPGSPCGR